MPLLPWEVDLIDRLGGIWLRIQAEVAEKARAIKASAAGDKPFVSM
jgi:hypothetical protein